MQAMQWKQTFKGLTKFHSELEVEYSDDSDNVIKVYFDDRDTSLNLTREEAKCLAEVLADFANGDE